MEQLDFNKLIKALTIAYPYYFKDMDKESAILFNQLYFSKLKKYDYQVAAKAIDNIITRNNYMPTLAEIIKECDKEYRTYNKLRIEELYKQGYFKSDEEFGKAMLWLLEEKPIIPSWLEQDMKKITDIKFLENEGIDVDDVQE